MSVDEEVSATTTLACVLALRDTLERTATLSPLLCKKKRNRKKDGKKYYFFYDFFLLFSSLPLCKNKP